MKQVFKNRQIGQHLQTLKLPWIEERQHHHDDIKENFSIRDAAEMCQISKSKLSHHVIDVRQHKESDFCIQSRMIRNQVFTTKQKDELESYLSSCHTTCINCSP